jgi:hypothetical protein
MLKRGIGSSLAFILASVMLISGCFALGSSASSGNGIKLSPLRYDLTIYPGKSQTVVFNVENVTKNPATYTAILTDFLANNQNGTPQLIVTGSKFDPFSIKQFVPKIPNFTVAPGQTKPVSIKISIPAGTAGGGYFGAIRFLAVNPETGKTVNVSASVAGLILISVPGPGMHPSLLLSGFSVGTDGKSQRLFYSNNGIEALVRFDNNGNVQIPPYGKIIVQNSSGKTIETKSVNNGNPPGNVLPDSYRTFSVPLSNIGSFGKYTVTGSFGYGNNGKLLSASVIFYVVAPWIIILAIVIIVLILTVIFFMPRLFRAWYKRSIRKVQVK